MVVKIYGPGWCMELRDGVNKILDLAPLIAEGDLQDGMLSYYPSQAGESDANIDSQLDTSFDFRDLTKEPPE